MSTWQLSPVAGSDARSSTASSARSSARSSAGRGSRAAEWLVDLPRPLLDLPQPSEPFRHPGPPSRARTARPTSPRHRRRRRLLVPAAAVQAGRVVVRRGPVSTDGARRRIDPRGRRIAGRRLARRHLSRGHAKPDGGDRPLQAGGRIDRRARRRARCCRSGSTACGTSCHPGRDDHDGHDAAGHGCVSGNPWSPPRAKRLEHSPSASKRRSGPFDRRGPRRLGVAARRPGDPAGVGFGEAVALPIVPDVLLGLLALATPAALGVPLVAAIAGAVVGSVALADLHRRRPDLVARIIALQPGLGQRGMAEARTRIERAGAARGSPDRTRAAAEGVRRRAHRVRPGIRDLPGWHAWQPSTA